LDELMWRTAVKSSATRVGMGALACARESSSAVNCGSLPNRARAIPSGRISMGIAAKGTGAPDFGKAAIMPEASTL